MKLQEYKDTPKDGKAQAFVQAKEDWLSILLHDWYSGLLDDLIEEFLNTPDLDIFQPSDGQIVNAFAQFASSKGR